MIVRELITKLGFKVDEAKLRRFNNNIKGSKQLMGELSGELRGMANGIRNVGIGLSAFVTLPIVALGFASVKTAANLEKARIALEVFLGSEEKALAVQKELIEFAKETPFQILGIQETAGQLLAAGIESDKLIETMNALGNAAKGDSVLFQRLVLNLSQVKTQGKLTGREMRDFLVAQVPLTQLLAKSLGVAESAIKDMTSSGEISFKDVEKAFFDASKEGGFFFDLMKKQSKTLTGRFSNLQDTITKLFAEFGDAIDKALHLRENIDRLIRFIDKLGEKFTALSPAMKKFIVFSLVAIAALGPLAIIIGVVATAFFALTAAALVFEIAILPLIGIILAIAAAVALISFAIFAVIDDFLTWKEGGDSLIGSLIDKFNKFVDELKAVGTALKNFFIEIGQEIRDAIPDFIKTGVSFLANKLKAPASAGPQDPRFSSNRFFQGGNSGLNNNTNTNSVSTTVNVEVPPGTTEQQALFLQKSAEKVYTEMTDKMLSDAILANPRNEN